jgi:hypothetical protein
MRKSYRANLSNLSLKGRKMDKFMRDYQIRDVLIYVELGKGFFIVSSAAYIALWSYPIILSTIHGGMSALAYLFAVISIVPISLPPLILAWATHRQLIKPLRENRMPSKGWRTALEVAGYFLGLFVAGLMLWIANRKIDNISKSTHQASESQITAQI